MAASLHQLGHQALRQLLSLGVLDLPVIPYGTPLDPHLDQVMPLQLGIQLFHHAIGQAALADVDGGIQSLALGLQPLPLVLFQGLSPPGGTSVPPLSPKGRLITWPHLRHVVTTRLRFMRVRDVEPGSRYR